MADTYAIDVQSFLNEHRVSLYQWAIFAMCFWIVLFDGFDTAAVAATFYPTYGRAIGVAWMLGLGRFGGIAGSFLVAELSRRSLTFQEIFAVVACPGLVAAVALTVKQCSRSERPLVTHAN